MGPSRVRVGMETGIASFAAALGILTIFWRDWIEALTGWDPDHHNGSAEWVVVAILLVVAAVVGALARRDWKLAAISRRSAANSPATPRMP